MELFVEVDEVFHDTAEPVLFLDDEGIAGPELLERFRIDLAGRFWCP
jgi:hypothetical protein